MVFIFHEIMREDESTNRRQGLNVTPFENVTRAALEEILKERLHESRRGYILTKDSFDDLVVDLFNFLKSSLSLN